MNRTTAEGTSRRTVIKGGAWSIPVVAIAMAAPAAAASVTSFVLVFTDTTSTHTAPLPLGDGRSYELTFPASLVLVNGPLAVPAGTSLSISLFWDASFAAEISPSSSTHTVSFTAPPFADVAVDGPINAGGSVTIDLDWAITSGNWAQAVALIESGQPVTVTASLSYDGHFDSDSATITGAIL